MAQPKSASVAEDFEDMPALDDMEDIENDDNSHDSDGSSLYSFPEYDEEAFFAEGEPVDETFKAHETEADKDRGSVTHSDAGSTQNDDPLPEAGIGQEDETVPRNNADRTWPPPGFALNATLSEERAEEMIANGAPTFIGSCIDNPTEGTRDSHYFAWVEPDTEKKMGVCPTATFTLLKGHVQDVPAWHTVEQPSMIGFRGKLPSTTTFTQYISASKELEPVRTPRNSKIAVKYLALGDILLRLRDSQYGIETSTHNQRDFLYRDLLYHPDYRTLEESLETLVQIDDLVKVLNTTEFVDYTKKENQVIGDFLLGAQDEDSDKVIKFYKQLVLSLELLYRLRSLTEQELKVNRLLPNLPACVVYNVTLAEIWTRNVEWAPEPEEDTESQLSTLDEARNSVEKLRLTALESQLNNLRVFARRLRWHDMNRVEACIRTTLELSRGSSDASTDNDSSAWNSDNEESKKEKAAPIRPLYDYSNFCLTFCSGLLLPGPPTAFALMETLAATVPELQSNTPFLCKLDSRAAILHKGRIYAYHDNVLAKVMGAHPSSLSSGGWLVAPAKNFTNIVENQLVLVNQIDVPHNLTSRRINAMNKRTNPLGPIEEAYPVADYYLPELKSSNPDHEPEDVQLISVDFCINHLQVDPNLPASPNNPLLWPCSMTFSVGEEEHLYKLRLNPAFLAAPRCHYDPHPLYFEHEVDCRLATKLTPSKGWRQPLNGYPALCRGDFNRQQARARAFRDPDQQAEAHDAEQGQDRFDEEDEYLNPEGPPHQYSVLAIDCVSGPYEEMLARAWCAHHGLNAVVCNLQDTCVSCAARMATAACIGVIIVVDKFCDPKTGLWKMGDGDGGKPEEDEVDDDDDDLSDSVVSPGILQQYWREMEELRIEAGLPAVQKMKREGKGKGRMGEGKKRRARGPLGATHPDDE